MLAFSLYPQFANRLPVSRHPRPPRTMHGYEGSCSRSQGGPRRLDGVGQRSAELGRLLRSRLGDHRPETPAQFVEVEIVDADARTSSSAPSGPAAA